ncbi:MAG: glycine--tRNA ligase subunit beta [Gammaproteobacteria bacterium]|nr:MAG: glycine--tRNA ligase subunit beta [Gammaproteobacteria bacterium]
MSKDFLVEIGTEELPPKSLKNLMNAFTLAVEARLQDAGLKHLAIKGFATPRRLAVLVTELDEQQAETRTEKLGPGITAAFDDDGKPTPAALGFARNCGVAVGQLETTETKKGKRLVFRDVNPGRATAELLSQIVEQALDELPIARRMRWGSSRVEFVRPIHWVVMLFGRQVITGKVMGINVGNQSHGHRFHKPGPLIIDNAPDYAATLRRAYVIADFGERRELIHNGVQKEAASRGGTAIIDEALLDEVTALNEWPVALSGHFEERFLAIPAPALISSMKEHQKYFHVTDQNGQLLPIFITIANIDSSDPAKVVAGNEKVIRPRLADADFFYKTDLHKPLAAQREKLRGIVFQEKLGSVFDKTERVARLAQKLASSTGADPELAKQAALLSKSDLVTEMVQEFNDLQGIMGEHYAHAEKLDPAIASALAEQYLPRFSGDKVPHSPVGITLALADRLDTLVGIFAIGQAPTGSSDPFALRRASLAVLRILVEHHIDLDLRNALRQSAQLYRNLSVSESSIKQVFTYIIERFHSWFEDKGIPSTAIQAVMTKDLGNPYDISQRIHAVGEFTRHSEASALASANKRVANILAKQSDFSSDLKLDPALLVAPEEKLLAHSIATLGSQVRELINKREYTDALAQAAALRDPVDAFFDQVMVMVDDEALRLNRLALLNQLRELFLEIADISLLAPTKS